MVHRYTYFLEESSLLEREMEGIFYFGIQLQFHVIMDNLFSMKPP